MHIHGPSHIHGAQAINSPHRVPSQTAPSTRPAAEADQLDISPEASLISQVKELPEIRADRVAEIRQQIEAGTYETDEKLDLALDRLLDELA